MNAKTDREQLLEFFKNQKSFTTEDVYRFFSSTQPEIKRATVNWRIYDLVQQGFLRRIGRGIYTLGNEKIFVPALDNKLKEVAKCIKKQFPLVIHCLWRLSSLKEFSRHISSIDFLIVEVDREAVDSVYYFLKENFKNTFKDPSKELISDFILSIKNALVVKTLVSESPIQVVNGISVPALEKILVDLYAETELFYFLQGNELSSIFENAVEKYTVNTDKLLRYANRRGKKEELLKMVNQTVNSN